MWQLSENSSSPISITQERGAKLDQLKVNQQEHLTPEDYRQHLEAETPEKKVSRSDRCLENETLEERCARLDRVQVFTNLMAYLNMYFS